MIICADDFGMCPAHDAAILELARVRRVSAVSVMLAMPQGAPRLAPALRELGALVDIGLHLVLTSEGTPRSGRPRSLVTPAGNFHAFGQLMRRGYGGQIRGADIRAEVQAQIQAFMDCFGRAPDHLDGHLHVQQLPGIRAAVAEAAAALCRTAPCYVRHAWTPPHLAPTLGCTGLFKQAAIAIPGAGLRGLLRRRTVPANRRFFGVYDYRQWRAFPENFRRFTAAARHANDIIMTHPGHGEPWRELEYSVLRAADDVIPNRFWHAVPP